MIFWYREAIVNNKLAQVIKMKEFASANELFPKHLQFYAFFYSIIRKIHNLNSDY